ncbi:hypothetical protein ACVXZ0_09130 [Staphylococcus aureus]
MVISMMVHAFYNIIKGESTEDYTLVSLLTKGGEEASLYRTADISLMMKQFVVVMVLIKVL